MNGLNTAESKMRWSRAVSCNNSGRSKTEIQTVKPHHKFARNVFAEHAWTRTWPLGNPASFGVRPAVAAKGGQDKGAVIPDAPLNCKYPAGEVLLKMRGQACPLSSQSCQLFWACQVTHPRK